MIRLLEKNHFIWLTLSLVGLMLVGALTAELPDSWTLRLIEYTSVVLLLLSLLSLQTNRIWGKRLLMLIGVLLAVIILRGATEFQYFEYFYLGTLFMFLVTAAWLVGSQVLLTGSVDLNKIVGSVALYLLLGLIWSIVYTVLLEFFPDSFTGIEAKNWYDNLPKTTYFSFVTLTTLGYGDISPARPLAEILVVLEAVSGMFYLAVIVASLIGTFHRRR